MPEIYSELKTGKRTRLLFTETILLQNINDTIILNIEDEKASVKFTFEVFFLDEGKQWSADSKLSDDGSTFSLYLYQWYSETFLENTMPYVLNLKDGGSIYLKYRTQANKSLNFRLFQISIWSDR